MILTIIIIGLLFFWLFNTLTLHSSGKRIGFAGQGYLIHSDGRIEKYGGIKDIVADSRYQTLNIGLSTTYYGQFSEFKDGKKEFIEKDSQFIATIYKSNLTMAMQDGRIISYSINLHLADVPNIPFKQIGQKNTSSVSVQESISPESSIERNENFNLNLSTKLPLLKKEVESITPIQKKNHSDINERMALFLSVLLIGFIGYQSINNRNSKAKTNSGYIYPKAITPNTTKSISEPELSIRNTSINESQ